MISGNGVLDLADNPLTVLGDPATLAQLLTTISGYIAQARNSIPDALWQGSGITSTTARSRADGITGLAAMTNAGDASSVLVKYAYNGDSDLNGIVDANDYFRIDQGYRLQSDPAFRGYGNGDVDYSGSITADDFYLIDRAFLRQSAGLAAQPLAAAPKGTAGSLNTAQGTVWMDLDANGSRAANEPGMPNITIYADLDGSGTLGPNEPSANTSASGVFALVGLPAGSYWIREVVPQGMYLTVPAKGGGYLVTLDNQQITGLDFGNAQGNPAGTVSGVKFNDLNANGTRDAGEPAIAGVTIYADLNDNGVLDPNEPSTITQSDNPATVPDETGQYTLSGVPQGVWSIREIVPPGMAQSYPGGDGAWHVEVVPGAVVSGRDFGNFNAIFLPDGNDLIHGGDGQDTLHGDNGVFAAPIVPIGGNDSIWGGAGDDVIDGQDKNDQLHGGDGNDTISGSDGNDTLWGDGGNDQLDGATGNDTYVFADSAVPTTDTLIERPAQGIDTIDMSAVTSAVQFDLNVSSATRAMNLQIVLQDGGGGDGSAWFENVTGSTTAANTLIGNAADNTLVGGNVADVIFGIGGSNTLIGGDGNDVLSVGLGFDWVVGGNGYDTLDYSPSPGPAIVNLQTASGSAVAGFSGIEKLVGSPSAFDQITGCDARHGLAHHWSQQRPDRRANHLRFHLL